MVEFVQNIFSWFVCNKDGILLFFTSANFASFVAAIVLFLKQIAATTNGVSTVSKLSAILTDTNALASKVADVSASVNTIDEGLKGFVNKLRSLEETISSSYNTLQRKLDAILEVQSIVYSSLKDDTARTNVSNILTSAKLVETASQVELQRQIDELNRLKEEIATKVNSVAEVAKKANLTSEQNVTAAPSNTVLRG